MTIASFFVLGKELLGPVLAIIAKNDNTKIGINRMKFDTILIFFARGIR